MGKGGPKPLTQEEYRDQLVSRFGSQFLNDIQRASVDPYFSQASLADRYGVSKTRISQIWERLHGAKFGGHGGGKLALAQIDEQACGCRFHPAQHFEASKHLIVDPKWKFHARVYYRAWEMLKSFGYHVSIPGNGYVMLVDGKYRVVTRGASHPITVLQKKGNGTQDYWRFIVKKQKGENDFILCFLDEIKMWYVIPCSVITTATIFINAVKQLGPLYVGKYDQFREAWHLLKE